MKNIKYPFDKKFKEICKVIEHITDKSGRARSLLFMYLPSKDEYPGIFNLYFLINILETIINVLKNQFVLTK